MASKNHDLRATVDDLRHIGLFARMSEAELAEVAALGEVVDAEPGAVIINQGDVGTECFLIMEGEAGVFAGGHHVASIGKGAIVGEMALIGHKPRNASVVAQTAMRLLAFNISSFKRLLADMPQAQKHIYDLLEQRARDNASHAAEDG
jgi:CRP/FNR family transcriptional regulator, cyclic AMP receptor protein